METLEFLVQGSETEPYKVRFSRDGNNLTARCTCRAGQVGTYCKHRLGMLEGKTDNIVSGNESEVAVVQSWLPGTDVEAALNELREAKQRVEAAQKELKRELEGYKKKLARVLMD